MTEGAWLVLIRDGEEKGHCAGLCSEPKAGDALKGPPLAQLVVHGVASTSLRAFKHNKVDLSHYELV